MLAFHRCCCKNVPASDCPDRCSPFPLQRKGNHLRDGWLGRISKFCTPTIRTRHRPSSLFRAQATIPEDLAHNHVLIAAMGASLSGQLFKSFTAALQGKGFTWKVALSSGGMPSAHSASVTAACTCLALERGFGDPLFGLSVIYAGLVMYDAQGVRRAVGMQAEVINSWALGSTVQDFSSVSASRQAPPFRNPPQVSTSCEEPLYMTKGELEDLKLSTKGLQVMASAKPLDQDNSSILSTPHQSLDKSTLRSGPQGVFCEENDVYNRSETFFQVAEKLPSVVSGQVSLQEIGNLDGFRHLPLKESVGHTKLEVLVGGLWGIFLTLFFSQVVKVGL